MRNPKVFIYLFGVVIFTATSCKSCKNKFSKEQPVVKEVSAYEDSAYAGLSTDTAATSSIDQSTASTTVSSNETTSSHNSDNKVTASASTNNTTNEHTSSSSNAEQKMTADVEKDSETKYASKRKRGVSSSIYDGVNDQEERYVIRKAEGYNDAYYIDDYNGTNKFYEEHYKKASKLEKPAEDYVDKSMNLPTSAYAKGVTQKSVNASLPAPEVVKPKAEEVKKGGTGSIGIPKKTSTTKAEKPKNAQEMLNNKQ